MKIAYGKRVYVGLCVAVLACLVPANALHAAIAVDFYQDMESGKPGELLSPSIMNPSSHGGGPWTIKGSLWVSDKYARDLPGSVTVAGATYSGAGSTRTWMFNDKHAYNFVATSCGRNLSKVTIACYLTVGPTCRFANQFDTIVGFGGLTWACLQMRNDDGQGPYICSHSRTTLSTFSPFIKVVAGKTYWVNLHFDGPAGKTSVAVFDPETWKQVGTTQSAGTAPGSTLDGRFQFGRADNHRDNPTCDTQSYLGKIVIDFNNAAFPLLPEFRTPASSPR